MYEAVRVTRPAVTVIPMSMTGGHGLVRMRPRMRMRMLDALVAVALAAQRRIAHGSLTGHGYRLARRSPHSQRRGACQVNRPLPTKSLLS